MCDRQEKTCKKEPQKSKLSGVVGVSLTPLYDNKLLESHLSIVPNREEYYLTKICLICYDYIWNDPFRNVLKADLVNYETTFEEIIKIFEIQEYNQILIMILLPNNHGTTSFGVPPKPTENLQEFFKQFNKILKKQAHLHLKNELQKE
ncbi:hypothetical protein RhiirA4_471054 [Rhizophagus irregularis]|uniref:Uncharacterized protein n=1 Tax=Rhizophagus irregularis TaxID=588596 RepID=A0A2I1H2D0_9GLOM|nr:hypothetical protein RhiirA4_471054 [Rhizophagus irregularis]